MLILLIINVKFLPFTTEYICGTPPLQYLNSLALYLNLSDDGIDSTKIERLSHLTLDSFFFFHNSTEGRFFTCQGNSASSCWSMPFFTVERKGEKREKFEGSIVRIFGVVFSVEDKNVWLCRSWNAGWRSYKSRFSDVLPVECNVERLTYRISINEKEIRCNLLRCHF